MRQLYAKLLYLIQASFPKLVQAWAIGIIIHLYKLKGEQNDPSIYRPITLLNRPSSIIEGAIDRLPQIECNVLLDEFPTVMKTRKAVQQLSSGKAPGADEIPAEVYKAGGYPWQRN